MLSLFSFPWTVLLVGILSLVMDKYTPVNSMSIKLITLEKGNQNDKKDIRNTEFRAYSPQILHRLLFVWMQMIKLFIQIVKLSINYEIMKLCKSNTIYPSS